MKEIKEASCYVSMLKVYLNIIVLAHEKRYYTSRAGQNRNVIWEVIKSHQY